MGKKTNSFDYKTLASYLLPKDILKFFDVTGVEEVHTGNVDLTGTEIPNGFTETCDITDFPVRDHKVVLRIRRRRWLDAEGHNVVFKNYELAAAGTSYSKEFAGVLKKIYGHLPYNSVFLSKVL